MNDADEHVVLVDNDGRSQGVAPKLVAHQKGLRHLAISVLIVNGAGELLLQRRDLRKYHSGGLWTNACCSHPRWGETPARCAERRLMEEMGFSCRLRPLLVTSYRAAVGDELIENELVHVFGGIHNGEVDFNRTEVAEIKWQSPRTVARDIRAHPDRYTVWFAKYVDEFLPIIETIVIAGPHDQAAWEAH